MKKKLLLPCPPGSKTMMKNPAQQFFVKLCDHKKQTNDIALSRLRPGGADMSCTDP